MMELPQVTLARTSGKRTAIREGKAAYTYEDLLEASASVAAALLDGSKDLQEERVAFQAPAGFAYFAIQWGIWRAGGVAVPLSLSATTTELENALQDSGCGSLVVLSEEASAVAPSRASRCRILLFQQGLGTPEVVLPEIDHSRRAMILFTSGTTSRPKGVVTTHANIQAQVVMLLQAWEWSPDDVIPLFLPMHHVHGIINIGSCALWSGATVECHTKFDMGKILSQVEKDTYTLFMAVPTIYVKLIEAFESRAFPPEKAAAILAGFSRMRLMVSGSAALPASVFEKWNALTGRILLERYGMTETGMMISNPLHGERRPGSVGQPLPTVEIRLKTEQGEIVTAEEEPGEIQVRGPAVFREYWEQPEVTTSSFDEGWFRTGDLAVIRGGYHYIMGRLSVDIIKSGGYKLSALEIEATLLDHPSIRECAVVGIKDDTWGEMVGVAAVLMENAPDLGLEELREWSRDRLSPYKIPRKLHVVESLPRNAMGKVTKPAVIQLLQSI